MQNKLHSLPASDLEQFLEEKVGEYLQENVDCEVSNLSSRNIDGMDSPAVEEEMDLTFDVRLSYKE